jgi:alpha-L-rhamnosidase
MLDMGATTIWERWDGFVQGRGFAWPLMNSFDHPVFGSVGEWVWRDVVGINPDETQPGYKHFIIRPRPAPQLDWVRGSYDSIRGQIRSEWTIADGNIVMTVEVPAGTTATVFVPTNNSETVRESGRPTAEAKGVRLLRKESEAVVFEVESGYYRFTASGVPTSS